MFSTVARKLYTAAIRILLLFEVGLLIWLLVEDSVVYWIKRIHNGYVQAGLNFAYENLGRNYIITLTIMYVWKIETIYSLALSSWEYKG